MTGTYAQVAEHTWEERDATGAVVATHRTTTRKERRMSATATDDRIDHDRDTEIEGQDPDKGKLFEVPRVAIQIDDTDPTVIKLSFSGGIELDRTNASDVETYNHLRAGQTAELHIEAHVAGAKTTHRRDSGGDVDAVVQTKSLVVHSLLDT